MAKKKSKKEPDRVLIAGKPDLERCDNKVVSARYTLLNFLPVAIVEQFRRFANVYFLVMGAIMFIGQYTNLYDTAISPWTTLGPLMIVISVSLIVEGFSDYKRHLSDHETNNTSCVILRRTDELEMEEQPERDKTVCKGRDVDVNMNKNYLFDGVTPRGEAASSRSVNTAKVAFQKIARKDIRQGHFVLVKNREMVPADLVLLASSNDQGGAYIETSSIDGETNLKLRNSPHLPKAVLEALKEGNTPLESINEEIEKEKDAPEDKDAEKQLETLDAATKRVTRFSYLGKPHGVSVMTHPMMKDKQAAANIANGVVVSDLPATEDEESWGRAHHKRKLGKKIKSGMKKGAERFAAGYNEDSSSGDGGVLSDTTDYVATLTSEPPNASVHTFSGKLTMPPFEPDGPCYEIPLGADNALLRGAVIRNTEWVIGLTIFTGTDTKLIMNSFETPSKFSQLDKLINMTVLAILAVMLLCIIYLSTSAIDANNKAFDTLFYAGFSKNPEELWPYFPADIVTEPPDWSTKPRNWIQFFMLYMTLLNNFVPLSLYITIEMVQFFMVWLVFSDLELYDDTTDTCGLARSTIVSDLGRVQYVFSDKTGTLTQNVMRFKRCSVDGMIFGASIQKTSPGTQEGDLSSAFHPLRQLLVGRFRSISAGLEGLGESLSSDPSEKAMERDDKLTFNSEMFLRVMSLCHTVVVEQDIDKKENISSGTSVASSSHTSASLLGKRRDNTGDSVSSPLGSVREGSEFDPSSPAPTVGNEKTQNTPISIDTGAALKAKKNSDGAPLGYAYQAESPDEGALVSAASALYGFQVVARDTGGIRLRCSRPSHLQDENLTTKLKANDINLDRLAVETAHELPEENGSGGVGSRSYTGEAREETWSILAINKFDSDRKRMSILLRSPPELGNLPILFCKGADSSMIDPDICGKAGLVKGNDSQILETVSEEEEEEVEGGDDMEQSLRMQVHLGEFAREGLRTLVLGMRVLTEEESTEWLKLYNDAATSIKDRETLLKEAALQIEKDLHIVGATAIEDKLQRNVPQTIATLGKAGIKLWVLTGDKRETAVEIGYSTNVLSSKMHVTEVPDNGKDHVRTQMAMEFIRLVKIGRLKEYQMNALRGTSGGRSFKQNMRLWFAEFLFLIGKCRRSIRRLIVRFFASMYGCLGMKDSAADMSELVLELEKEEKSIMREIEWRREIRKVADKTIRSWLKSEEGIQSMQSAPATVFKDDEQETILATEEPSKVFVRATSAQGVLQELAYAGDLSQPEVRQLSIAHLTAHQVGAVDEKEKEPIVDEDTLSLDTFVPGGVGDKADYDKKKRTILERLFAVDREVRKGRLKKHMTRERLREIAEARERSMREIRKEELANNRNASRALVIEGAALKHLLGDPDFEEILFAVASNCDAVIACRASPRQKAQLVNLVRQNVTPEPITLAIGDGANDVGMIQEAHVGVGISGKEGKQAVNASDFAIAQFRFLETLVLIHGRWNFFRLSSVVLFSFYKNAVMAGTIIIYTERTLYSGTPLYDEWIMAMLNFVAAWPILFTGLFDRCLSKDYVRKHPEVFKATRENQLITIRSVFRWILLCFAHVFLLYYFTVPLIASGGGITSAFQGQMRNEDPDRPGDGEGGDLKSVGTVTFTCMIFLMAYKVIYESRSLVHGKWPPFTCRKGVGEGYVHRLAYTWIGVTVLSMFFYLFAISTYQLVGRRGASEFSNFTLTTNHVLGTRSINWMLILFVPIMGMAFDVCGKVFSNMFYPTQTQIHLELESRGKMLARHRRRREASAPAQQQNRPQQEP